MSNWISIEVELPADKEDVLTFWQERQLIQLQRFYKNYLKDGDDWWIGHWQNLIVADKQVTHWMPLPPPPHNSFINA